MYERSYGSKYDGSLSTTEIAKRIRADIKAAVAAGELPGKPVSYSVRSAYFSGGSSIDVTIRDLPDAFVPEGERDRIERKSWLTREAFRVLSVVEAIHWAYNHNGSESQVDYFDVNYYGHVEIESESSRDFRLREAERAKLPKPAKPICEFCHKPIRTRHPFTHYNNCEPAIAAMRARVAALTAARSNA